MRIQSTTNYHQFKDIRGNREINRVHLNKLVKSIEDNDMLEANPIIVNDLMQILDGQHRLLAAEKLGVPIHYVVIPTGNISEVQLFNSNLRAWTMINFLNSYIARGNENYVELKKFMDKTGLSLGISLMLFSGTSKAKNGRSTVNDFKNGDFTTNFKEFAETTYKAIKKIAPFCDDVSWNDREMVSAMMLVHRAGITYDDLIEKIERSGMRIPRFATRKPYIRLFEDILSYKKKTPVRLI